MAVDLARIAAAEQHRTVRFLVSLSPALASQLETIAAGAGISRAAAARGLIAVAVADGLQLP